MATLSKIYIWPPLYIHLYNGTCQTKHNKALNDNAIPTTFTRVPLVTAYRKVVGSGE